MSNILLLSAGRRVELALAFKVELQSRKLAASLLATDLKPELSAACQIVDIAVRSPKVTDPSYIEFLLDLCEKKEVKLVIPTIDTELLDLAKYRSKFEKKGINISISEESLVQVCRDKRLTTDLFTKLGIETPKIYSRSNIKFPCFVKPYDGSCSVGASVVKNAEMLAESMLTDQKLMFMEFIDETYDEYTVDVYYDRLGRLISFVPRQRIEVRGGEISKGVTRKHFVYDYLLEKLQGLQGARGCLTLQLFANERTKKFAALEINPRFGGGYPLSYCAGANYPGYLIDEYLFNKSVSFCDSWEANLMMLRYDAKVLVHGYS